jgi:23S rRNA (cytosine1962-C5)-methyltransferase
VSGRSEPAEAPVGESAASSEYELLDLGGGRRLERFGTPVVDRPYPAAIAPPADIRAWAGADLRYERETATTGRWEAIGADVPAAWTMRHGGLVFELRPTASGQVGFFAEQVELWRWVAETIGRSGTASLGAGGSAPAVLNLFAYTGGATLAAADAGAAVTHVDASRAAVAWARRNAELSGLRDAPIRWIVDDALTFVRREGRRARRYRGFIIDPPSYGHGIHGERWTLSGRLPELLDAALALSGEPFFVLLTAHTEGLTAIELGDQLQQALGPARASRENVEAAALVIRAGSGASAPAGVMARWRA